MIVLSKVKKLYDGASAEASSVRENVDLLLEGERIRAVEPHLPDRRLSEADARVDASAWTITPGLVDCHGHVTILGLTKDAIALMDGPTELIFVEKILHTTLVDGGVTSMRDIGGATHFMKRLVDEGTVIGPRLKLAICMLSTTGGHADMRGPDRCHAEVSKLWKPGPGRPSSIVDGPWECRKRVREIAACGADLVKLCTSPGVASPGDKLEHRDFTAEEIAAICEEAAARGLPVAAHAHSISGIDLAIANGVHDVQHVSWMSAAQVERAAAAGCVVTPTSWVIDELTRAEGLSEFVMEKVKQVAGVHRAAVQHAASGDLPVLMGTDPVLPGMHGRNFMELVHLVRDGLSPLRAWHGSTGLAAREIGQHDSGTLAPGQRADLCIWSADVIANPERLDGALHEVVKDGVAYRGAVGALPQRTYGGACRATLWPRRVDGELG